MTTADSIRPLTIKQVIDTTQNTSEAEFKIDGSGVVTLCIVGQVISISQLTTYNTYKLDDGTGSMEIKHWKTAGTGADDELEKPNPIREGNYVKVFGKLSVFNNRISITAHAIKAIPDPNEYYCHFLEATAVHLYFTRGPLKSQQSKAAASAGAGGGDSIMTNISRELPSMSISARKVYDNLANTPVSNEGMHVQAMAISTGMPISEVMRACEELSNCSLIYPTVDEETFALLES